MYAIKLQSLKRAIAHLGYALIGHTKRVRGHQLRIATAKLMLVVMICHIAPASLAFEAGKGNPKPKSGMSRSAVVTTKSAFKVQAGQQGGDTVTIFGPRRFERAAGPPITVVENFSLSSNAVPPFLVQLQNGAPDGSGRVSSATVKLNGEDLFTQRDFNQNIALLERPANLITTNRLEVRLASAPGSFITITFIATLARLESVTPTLAAQGQTISVTLHGRNTHWAAGQTRASFGAEVSVGGAAAGELGPVQVIDSITAVAQLTVHLTAALAPRLVRVETQIPGSGQEGIALDGAFKVTAISPPGSASSNVATIAGLAGSPGFVDGLATQARFRNLAGIAIGASDAIYVADSGNNCIRVAREESDSAGNPVLRVSTHAGDGTAGFLDGQAASARFNDPQGVAVDSSGMVYVADTGNNRIRRIAVDGSVSTLAGDGTPGFQNGRGSQARFNSPRGVAIDGHGNIYVADTGNSAVRFITPAGDVGTVAGDGSIGSNDSPAARFDGVTGVVVDGENVFVYLADTGNHRIRRLDPQNQVITIAGAGRGFADGSATQARFAEPSGMAVDGSGNIVVADTVNSLIREVDPVLAESESTEAVTTIAGKGERGSSDGTGNAARFQMPRGVAVTASGSIIVADTANHTLRRILIPPRITSINPERGRALEQITINGQRFDGRLPDRNVVLFTRAAQSGGGQTAAQVTFASRTQLTVVVPADAATGPITVQTQGGTATSPANFEVIAPVPVISDFNPKSGSVGTVVTITGTALKTGTTSPIVTFTGSNNIRVPALVSFSSPAEVRAAVPNGAVTGPIELANAFGRAVSSEVFTVTTSDQQDFQITVAPPSTSAVQHGTATYVVTLTGTGPAFTQLAQLSTSGLPAGTGVTFEPEQLTAGASSTMSVGLADANLSAGSYSFSVRAAALVAGSETVRTQAVTLNVIAAGQTTLSGRVLSTEKEAIIGATVSLDGRTATTDAAGAFLLSGVNAGADRPLMVDGRTASAPNRTYPVIIEPATIVAGQANVVPFTFYLPPIDTQSEVDVVPGRVTEASNQRVPGLKMTIPVGANLRNRDGSPVARVSITPLAIDRTPAPLPSNVATNIVYTSQPGGALTDIAIPVIYPNLAGANPGTRVELYAFNHDTVKWYVYGFGKVSNDGRSIEPEINPATGKQYGLLDFSWHFPNVAPEGNPNPCDEQECEDSCTKNTVDLSTGVKIEKSLDISFGGARGGLMLERINTSDLAGACDSCPFGRGTTHNYSTRLTGSFQAGGAGRVVMPGEISGRLFSYVRTDSDGALVFSTTATIGQLGDVVRKLTNGTSEYRFANGSVMRFDSGGSLIAVADRNGDTITLTYAGSNLIQVTDPVNRSLTLSYDGSNRISSVTDPIGRVWRYSYDGGGRLAIVTDPLSNPIRYEYDFLSRLVSVIDKRGNTKKQITYDSNGRVIQQRFADGGLEQYSYTLSGRTVTSAAMTDSMNRSTSKRFNASGYVTAGTDAMGQSSRIDRDLVTNLATSTVGPCGCVEAQRQFDAKGNLTALTDRLGQTTRKEYEPVFNKVVKLTDKLGRVTTYGYDARGNLTTITNPLNQTTGMTYDSFGEMTSITDRMGHTTQFEYDASGNLTATIDPLGNRSTTEYDAIGRVTATSDALNRREAFQYDALGRVIAMTDASGATTHYGYDANGNQNSITDALNKQWLTVYDEKNRLISVTDPIGRVTRLQYNNENELTQTTSQSGRTIRYGYDQRGLQVSITDPLNGVVRFAHDNRKNLTSLTDQRGNTTTFGYDELYRVTSMRDPLGRISSVKYNANGKVIEETDRLGRKVTTSYDALDRIAQAVYADATVALTYDAASRLTRIDDTQGGTIQRSYDDADRLLNETTAAGVVRYSYNAANQVISMTAADRPAVSYGYDAAGRLQSIAQNAETFTYGYDVLSRAISLQRPNGVNTSYSYDEVGRLTRLTHSKPSSAPIEDYSYTYDADEGIDSITSLASAPLLPQARDASPADAANRVAQFGPASYTFDNVGQTTSRTDAQGTTRFDWDTRGRMARATLPDGQAISYTYDALGRRTSRAANGLTTEFLYDGNEIVLDRTSDGSALDYIYGSGIDDMLRQSASGASGPLYFLQDHLSSLIALTDANGNVSERISYEPFGNSAGTSFTRYDYTGREADAATGLIYYRARWYDPQQGRFISEDPIGHAGGYNLYAYVSNQPTGAVDPLGLKPAPLKPSDAWIKTGIEDEPEPINRRELEKRMSPDGPLPQEIKDHIDRGCIGLTTVFQDMNCKRPEKAPGTFCYLEQIDAILRPCKDCEENFIFAIQGRWSGKEAPKPDENGRVPNNSISHSHAFNYITYFPSTMSYAWMNNWIGDGPQEAYIGYSPYSPGNKWHTIWCSTCKPKK